MPTRLHWQELRIRLSCVVLYLVMLLFYVALRCVPMRCIVLYCRVFRGVLPSKRLMGMYRWIGSHFHNWTDYNGVKYFVELLELGRTFSGFLGYK